MGTLFYICDNDGFFTIFIGLVTVLVTALMNRQVQFPSLAENCFRHPGGGSDEVLLTDILLLLLLLVVVVVVVATAIVVVVTFASLLLLLCQ
jgi:hypothetical protein